MTAHRRRRLVAALPLVVVLLTGCELRADVDVAVDDSGGGTLAVTLQADEALRRSARATGADPLAALTAAGRQAPGWRVRGPDAEGVVTLATTFDDPEELERISTQFARAVATPELQPLGPMQLVMGDDTVTLRGSAGLAVTDAVRDIGYSPARARAVVADSVRLEIGAQMPGEVLQTNAAQRQDARSVRWVIPAGGQRQLQVVSARPWTVARVARLLITPAGLLVLVIGLALVLGWRWAQHETPQL